MSEESQKKPIHRKQHDRQFKLEAVKLVIDGDRKVGDVARSLGINAGTLRMWKWRYEQEHGIAQQAFPGKGHLAPADEEVRRLKRQLQQAEQERDILKKALAFFSRTDK